jgi:DNA modification methylase
VTVTLHLGDCLDVMRGMPDACVDAVVTDPPYAATGTASSFVSRASKSSVPRETQFYEAWLREHLREWMRLVKPTGALWMTIDWRGAMSLDAACARLGARAPKVGVWYRRGLGMGFVLRNVTNASR